MHCIACQLNPNQCTSCSNGYGVDLISYQCAICDSIDCILCTYDYKRCIQCINDGLHGVN